MTSVDSCHADLGLAAVPCPDEVLTQLQKVSVVTFSRTKVAAGASLSEAFPLNERLRAAYEAWRKQQVT
jgi:hypothetical protein